MLVERHALTLTLTLALTLTLTFTLTLTLTLTRTPRAHVAKAVGEAGMGVLCALGDELQPLVQP